MTRSYQREGGSGLQYSAARVILEGKRECRYSSWIIRPPLFGGEFRRRRSARKNNCLLCVGLFDSNGRRHRLGSSTISLFKAIDGAHVSFGMSRQGELSFLVSMIRWLQGLNHALVASSLTDARLLPQIARYGRFVGSSDKKRHCARRMFDGLHR